MKQNTGQISRMDLHFQLASSHHHLDEKIIPSCQKYLNILAPSTAFRDTIHLLLRMKPPSLVVALAAASQAYYTMLAYAPSEADIHGQVINAKDRAFVVGAKLPTTYCDLDIREQCPNGSSTLINNDMTSLAASVLPSSNRQIITIIGRCYWWTIHLRRPRRIHLLPLSPLRPSTSWLADGRVLHLRRALQLCCPRKDHVLAI